MLSFLFRHKRSPYGGELAPKAFIPSIKLVFKSHKKDTFIISQVETST